MRVLAIDTLAACAAVVLDTDHGVVASETLPMVRGHAKSLIPLTAPTALAPTVGSVTAINLANTTNDWSGGLKITAAASRDSSPLSCALRPGRTTRSPSTASTFRAESQAR